ncbi:MAG: hypothetical protein WC385_01810 [Candidatus Paceibacterota bacterium]
MNKKSLYLILGIIVIILIIITVKGFSLLSPAQTPDLGTATTTAGIPDGLAISDELGGNKSPAAPVPTGTVRGSCYVKADSQCIDYFGSAFSPDRIKAVCSNDGAVISTSGSNCPSEAKVGGCRTMVGTEMEMIAWAYSNGDKPVEGDMLEFNKTLCNGMAKSNWIEVK